MTKLEKVLKFMNRKNKGAFTWKEFIAYNKCSYPCTETNYLNMLVKAQYVAHVGRGKYEIWITPARGMSYAQLKQESSGNYNVGGNLKQVFMPGVGRTQIRVP